MSAGASVTAGGRPLLIVTGLSSEARIAEGAGMTDISSSSDPRQLRAQLQRFDHAGVRGIISFGAAIRVPSSSRYIHSVSPFVGSIAVTTRRDPAVA